MVGNYFESSTEAGRYDGDYGTILINKGKGNFSTELLNGKAVKGQVRHIQPLKTVSGKQTYILARNNDSTVVLQFKN
jgi:hypothetical protein